MNREIASTLLAVTALAPAALTANTAGVIIDTQDFDAAMLVAQFGAAADAAATITIEHGDESDLSDAAALTPVTTPTLDGFLYGEAFPVGQTDTVVKYSYVGPKRYLRLNFVGGAGPTDFAALAVLGKANDNKVD